MIIEDFLIAFGIGYIVGGVFMFYIMKCLVENGDIKEKPIKLKEYKWKK
jgi:hypothetical protein